MVDKLLHSSSSKALILQKHTFQHSSHDISKRWSQPPSGAGQGDMRQAQYEQGPAVAVRSMLLVSDPDHPGIRTLARWPRVRHAATELPACTLQRSSGSWVRRRLLPVLWISALCHVSGYNSSYDMIVMSLVTSLRRQDSVVFRIPQ